MTRLDGSRRSLVVLGSAQQPGRLHRALVEAIARAQSDGEVGLRLLDLAERRLGFADGREPGALADDTAVTLDEIAAADPVIFATPVYRGSMTGTLKNLFDQLPVPALAGKTVGLVAMGGSDHHFLGPDRHLRDVLSFFGALVLPVSVYFTSADFDEDGEPSRRVGEALDELIDGAHSLARATEDGLALGPSPLSARMIRG